MRYLADDGEIFDYEELCIEHEGYLNELENKIADIEVFLKEKKAENPERSKAMYRRVIREWLLWENRAS